MSGFKEIQQKLADYCVYQDRCHWEVEQKMKEFNLISEAQDEILIFLIQNNFLNEERFARSYARGKFYQKKWGKRKIANGLRQRKISEKLIEWSFEEIDTNDYRQCLSNLAEKKWQSLSHFSLWEKKKKVQSYLQQKGYEWDLILEEMKNFSDSKN